MVNKFRYFPITWKDSIALKKSINTKVRHIFFKIKYSSVNGII